MTALFHFFGFSSSGIYQDLPAAAFDQEDQDRKFFFCFILFHIFHYPPAAIMTLSETYAVFSFLFPVSVLVSPCILKVINTKAQAMKRIPPRTMYWVPILERK